MGWIDRIVVQTRFFAEMGWTGARIAFHHSVHLLPQALSLHRALSLYEARTRADAPHRADDHSAI